MTKSPNLGKSAALIWKYLFFYFFDFCSYFSVFLSFLTSNDCARHVSWRDLLSLPRLVLVLVSGFAYFAMMHIAKLPMDERLLV